jgi:hypothetical protein
MIAHSASNCVADLSIGIDKDFFRSLLRMAVRWRLRGDQTTRTLNRHA